MKINIPILFLFLICAPLTVLSQTTRYVATTGNNTGNNCTNPGNPCETIIHALNEATSNDIIELAPGEYTQSQSGGLLIQKSITIQGADRETTFIQAHAQPNQAGHRTINIASLPIEVIITDVTIRNGVASGSGISGRGGGVYYDFDINNPGTLEISNARFVNNTARVGGGIFVASESSPFLETIIFQDNNATERGGAIYLYTNSQPVINNTVFNTNSAGISGGAIYAGSSHITFVDCNFSSNYASLGCSAVAFQSGSTGTITGGSFQSHQTAGSGGAICIDGGSSPEFSSVEFTNNEALGGQGGAVHIVNNSSPIFNNVSFTNNQAVGTESEDGGGAIFINTNSEPEFIDVLFSNNTAHYNGGAVLSFTSTAIFVNTQFSANNAGFWGGAMANMNGSSPTLENVIFEENTAASFGGGMINVNGSSPDLNEIQFIENTAVAGGGMVNYGSCSPQMSNVFFIGNTGQEGGGGMYNLDNSHPEIVNTVFADNTATEINLGNGAGIYNENSSPYILNTTFSKNQATGGNSAGGGMANYGTSAPIIFNTIFWDNLAAAGNEIFNNNSASASLHFSLYANETGDIIQGAGFTCSDCLNENPLFSNPGNNHFQLMENSPAINAGDPNTALMPFPTNGNGDYIDVLGNPRVFDNIIDIGAYEWNDNLSIADSNNQFPSVALYPNPVTDVLYIQSEKEVQQMVLVNLLGQSFPLSHKKYDENTFSVNMSGYNSGIYMLKIFLEGQIGTYKFIKQ